jgi:hypothetical protein
MSALNIRFNRETIDIIKSIGMLLNLQISSDQWRGELNNFQRLVHFVDTHPHGRIWRGLGCLDPPRNFFNIL